MEIQVKNIHLVIGGFGFVGNQLIKHLLSMGENVFCVDDDSSGNCDYSLQKFKNEHAIQFLLGDITKESTRQVLIRDLSGISVVVWHLAANSDIQSGSNAPTLDAQKTFLTSVAVCELLRDLDVINLNFASTSAVYGESSNGQMFNEMSICNPISFYGISKYASEKFLEISAQINCIPLLIFRFANIVGTPATHGVIFDFINKLKSNPNFLNVLGNGEQTKSYLHVENLIQMMCSLWSRNESGVFNLGPGDTGISVRDIAMLLTNHLQNSVEIRYGTNPRGWNGDAVKVLMSTERINSFLNFRNETSFEAVHKAIHDISDQLEFDIVCRNPRIS